MGDPAQHHGPLERFFRRHPSAATEVLKPPPLFTDPCSDAYVFLSYAREDASQIEDVLRCLEEWAFAVWYDQDIPGGTEWQEMIESKITDCGLLLLFFTERAAGSQWVKREVRFADRKRKPIVIVQLEEPDLGHGLDMILSERQILKASHPDFPAKLGRAIEFGLAGL